MPRIAIALAGLAFSIPVLVYEWCGVPLYLSGVFEALPLHFLSGIMRYEQAFVMIAAFFCSLWGACVISSALENAGFRRSILKSEPLTLCGETAEGHAAGLPNPDLATIAGSFSLFICGVAKTAAFSPFVPFVLGEAMDPVVSTVVPRGFVFVPVVGSFFTAMLYLGLIGNLRASADSEDGFCIRALALSAAFPIGLIAWNYITRVVPIAGASLYIHWKATVALSVLFCCCWVFSFVIVRKDARAVCASVKLHTQKERPATCCEEARETLLGQGLTAREIDAVLYTAQGMSSNEVAQKLEIKAPTVRSYLQRAYRKMGVRTADEMLALDLFRNLVPADEAHGNGPVNGSVSGSAESVFSGAGNLESTNIERALSSVSFFATLSLFAVVLLPHEAQLGLWASGRLALVGCGLGFAGGGLGALLLRRCGCVAVLASRRVGVSVRAVAIVLEVLSTAGVMRYLGYLSIGFAPSDCLFSFTTLAAWVFLSAFGMTVACRCVLELGDKMPSCREGALGLLFAAVVCVSFCSLRIQAICSFLFAALSCLAVVFLPASRCVSASDGQGEQNAFDGFGDMLKPCSFSLGICSLSTGASFVALWRGADAFAVSGGVSLFWAIAIFGCVVFFVRVSKKLGIAVVIVAVLSGVLAALGSKSALFACLVALLLCVAIVGLREKVLGCAGMLRLFVSFGVGCLAAFVGFDMLGDTLILNETRLSVFGGRLMLYQMVSVGFGVIALGLGLLCWAMLESVLGSIRLAQMEKAGDRRSARQIEHFLYSKGLNDTQVSVLTGVIGGLSTKQISERLNYACGTVKSARAASYQSLGVHTRSQLIALINKNISS